MSNTNPTPEHQVRRPGIKSSEFVLSALGIALVTALPALSEAAAEYLKESPYAALSPAIIIFGYTLSRGIVKKSRNDASGVAAAIPNVAAGGDVKIENNTGTDSGISTSTVDQSSGIADADEEFN